MLIHVYEDLTATSSPESPLFAEGRAMRDAILADLGACGQLLSDENYRDKHVLLIAPETGGRLEFLANKVIEQGGTLIGPSPEGIRHTADKWELAHHWRLCGVNTPPTWLLGEHPRDRALVVKPRDGAGSQNTGLHADGAAIPHGEGFIAQEFIAGFAASVAFLIGPNAWVPLMPCEQRLENFTYLGGRLPIRPDLASRAVAITTSAVRCVPGLHGYVGVDVILGDDGRDWAIEINPRLTTSYLGLRRLAKFNIAEAMLAIREGSTYRELTWHDHSVEFAA